MSNLRLLRSTGKPSWSDHTNGWQAPSPEAWQRMPSIASEVNPYFQIYRSTGNNKNGEIGKGKHFEIGGWSFGGKQEDQEVISPCKKQKSIDSIWSTNIIAYPSELTRSAHMQIMQELEVSAISCNPASKFGIVVSQIGNERNAQNPGNQRGRKWRQRNWAIKARTRSGNTTRTECKQQ